MPLAIDEITPGVVAYLDTAVLLRDTRLTRRGSDTFRAGPFLCVAFLPGRTVWIKLTSQPGQVPHRLQLRPEWLLGGSARWRAGPTYCSDLREPFIGRDVVFADAARAELPGVACDRPRVSATGVATVRAAMIATRTAPFLEEIC
jgi:hypothetical protein